MWLPSEKVYYKLNFANSILLFINLIGVLKWSSIVQPFLGLRIKC